MKTALAVIAVLILPISRPSSLLSQTAGRVKILELRFDSDSAGTPTIDLEKGTVYWAELDGRGDLVLQSVRTGRQAFIVPVEEGREPLRFQIYPFESGLHSIALRGGDSGVVATVRLYRDVAETARIRDERDRAVAIGFSFAGGLHTGLGIDSLGGTDPSGGGDVEGCLLLRSGGPFALCPGVGRQSFPDAGLAVGWIFVEAQLRLLSRQLFTDRNTDLSGTLRFSKATGVGSRNSYPEMFGLGLQLTQHLSARGHRRGISLLSAWQHGWLSSAPESQDRATDRFMAGLIWLP